nr:P-loop NTPase fold protein [Sphingosinicella soli]
MDRCRPTYAVKLLEEIKHLFDVSGIVFILALHGEQLGHSVSGAYGAGFDGRAYLRRFIDREYRLAQPNLTPLLKRLCANSAISDMALSRPQMAISQARDLTPPLPELLAEYMRVYGLSTRDAFELIDIIPTSIAILERQHTLHAEYFLPLAIGLLKGLPAGKLPEPQNETSWVYVPNWSYANDATEISFADIAAAIQKAASLPDDRQQTDRAQLRSDYVARLVYQSRVHQTEEQPFWTIYGYPRLLGTVARFTNPQLDSHRPAD